MNKLFYPYRSIEKPIQKDSDSSNLICRWIGCQAHKHSIPNLIYVAANDGLYPIISAQECIVCNRQFAQLHYDTDNLKLICSHNSKTGWMFLYTPFSFKGYGNSNILDREYDVETKTISSLRDIDNFNFIRYKHKIVCSNVGCRLKKILDTEGGTYNHVCKRCGNIIPEVDLG